MTAAGAQINMEALVVYYSRSGMTRTVANAIAEALEGDVGPICDVDDRRGLSGYLASGIEALAKGVPSIERMQSPRNYDLVVLGTPVWVGTIASPMRSYLLHHGRELSTVAFFCTMGARGGEEAIREMGALCGVADAPRFMVKEADVRTGRYERELARFIDDVESWARPRPHRGT